MRIAVPTEGQTKEAPVSPHFGRCDYYCIYDSETLAFDFVTNPFVKENAAGNKAAGLLHDHGVDFVIAQEIGSKAQQTLNKLQIKTFHSKSEGSLIDQIYKFMERDLPELTKGTKDNKHDHVHHEAHDHNH